MLSKKDFEGGLRAILNSKCARSIQNIGPVDSIVARRRRHTDAFFDNIDPKRTNGCFGWYNSISNLDPLICIIAHSDLGDLVVAKSMEATMVANIQKVDLARREINRGGPQVCNPPTYCRDCLSASALAAELTADQVHALFNVVEVRKLSKNEILISEGEYDDHLYALAKGELEISRGGERGQEVLGRLGPGSITGELAFLDGLKRTATVKVANDESCVIVLRRQQLESLLSVDPSLVYKVMRAVVRSAHRTVGKMDATYTDLMHYISG